MHKVSGSALRVPFGVFRYTKVNGSNWITGLQKQQAYRVQQYCV